VAGGGRVISGRGRREGSGGEGSVVGQPLAVVAAKYYFNGDSNVVFRYRLYSFHSCPVSWSGGCACMPDARSPCVRVELPSCSTRRTRLMGARPEVQIGK